MGLRSSHEPEPLYATPRSNRETLGPQIAEVMARSAKRRVEPMPWQRAAYDLFGEIDPATGLFWYKTCILIVLRQAGKSTMTRGKLTHRALTTSGAQMLYTAQDRNSARRRLEKTFYNPLKDSPLAGALLKPRWAAGSEALRWRNGSELGIISNSATAGHGDTLDEVHIDEAFAHRDNHVEQNVNPTMITVRGSQKWILSAAGDENSSFLWTKREQGQALARAGRTDGRVAYIEYAAPAGSDRDDPATWLCHPAIGHTIELSDIQAEHDGMDADEFDRAYLGWWPSTGAEATVIPWGAWVANYVDPEALTWRGEPLWAVDVSPDRTWASIALAAESFDPDARAFIEVIDHERGTGWCVSRLRDLANRFGGGRVALDTSGAASSLEQDLVDAGFEVVRLMARERVDACGGLHDDVVQSKVHYLNDPVLNGALKAAEKANAYGGEAWLFTRGKSRGDITPLYAAALARQAYVKFAADNYDILDSIG